jgi:hypothetical protein
MTYKDNTPTYNVNRKVVNFGDFCKTCEEPKLKKMRRQTTPNSDERQKLPGNFKQKFNPVTRKIDNLSPDEINDRIENIEEMDESKLNESHIDYDIMDKITKLESYTKLKSEIRRAVEDFEQDLDEMSAGEIGYDSGDNDHHQAYVAAVKEILDEIL